MSSARPEAGKASEPVERGYVPGAIGRIAELHALFYERHAGFGLYFESKVASELCEFLNRYDEKRDGIWLLRHSGLIQGSIVIDGIEAATKGAHLRWFIVSGASRGKGSGHLLLGTALDFCRQREFASVYLWTFGGLQAARHLYEKYGFRQTQQNHGSQWGREVDEQRFELRL